MTETREVDVSLEVGGRVLIKAISYSYSDQSVRKSVSEAQDSAAEFFEDGDIDI